MRPTGAAECAQYAAQRGPIVIRVDALVLNIGVDQVDEGLCVQLETANRVGERDQDRMRALVVVEALAGLVAPAAQASHRDRAVSALVAEVIGEPAERVHPGQVAAQRPRREP